MITAHVPVVYGSKKEILQYLFDHNLMTSEILNSLNNVPQITYDDVFTFLLENDLMKITDEAFLFFIINDQDCQKISKLLDLGLIVPRNIHHCLNGIYYHCSRIGHDARNRIDRFIDYLQFLIKQGFEINGSATGELSKLFTLVSFLENEGYITKT